MSLQVNESPVLLLPRGLPETPGGLPWPGVFHAIWACGDVVSRAAGPHSGWGRGRWGRWGRGRWGRSPANLGPGSCSPTCCCDLGQVSGCP